MMPKLGEETIEIHILSNISRSKDNQAMKFGQLIEYRVGIIFLLKNNTQNVLEKLFSGLFLKSKIE